MDLGRTYSTTKQTFNWLSINAAIPILIVLFTPLFSLDDKLKIDYTELSIGLLISGDLIAVLIALVSGIIYDIASSKNKSMLGIPMVTIVGLTFLYAFDKSSNIDVNKVENNSLIFVLNIIALCGVITYSLSTKLMLFWSEFVAGENYSK